jgi:hypothetical protein
MAGHNIELAQPEEVLAYLQAASRAGRRARFTHGERSNQHAIAAWANAQSGHAPGVHRQAGLAEEQFASAEDRTGPDWQVRHVAEAELYSLTGAGYTELPGTSPATPARRSAASISHSTCAVPTAPATPPWTPSHCPKRTSPITTSDRPCMPVSLGMSVPGISAGTGQGWCLVAPGDSLHA